MTALGSATSILSDTGGIAPPSVSVIMPCYNAAGHLPRSVQSVQSQTYPDWELIAVDDGSTDATLAWLRAQTDPRIRVVSQSNKGVSVARNAGLAVARGTYVAFLDADDRWAPTFLTKMACALEARPDAVLAYCGWQNVGVAGGRGNPFVPPDYETPGKAAALFAGCRWPIHAALTRRSAIAKAGGFDPALRNAEDYVLWLEIAAESPIVRVPEVLAYYHFHDGGQASANRARAALQHVEAQLGYLARHPEFAATLGRRQIRKLVFGALMRRGFEAYWERDLQAARAIFQAVMKQGYGSASDWRYMLPSLLPLPLHSWLIARAGKAAPSPRSGDVS